MCGCSCSGLFNTLFAVPPKNAGEKKAAAKAKAKAAEDKTFGMKNKNKSKKVQQYIEQVKTAATAKSRDEQKRQEALRIEKEQKKLVQQRKAEADALQAGEIVIKQKPVPFGVDPKTIVCEFFKAKKCTKGDKCKFSHDLNAGRKVEKRDIHVDLRQKEREEKEKDTMDKWDEEKLNSVISSKQTTENKNLPTKIVCKYFLDAIENSKFGWFWECPNGGKKCMYQHALPPGYVLKSEKKRLEDEAAAGPTLEELIEVERQKIGSGTPVVEQTFLAWKRRKLRDEMRQASKKAEERQFDPSLFNDDIDDVEGDPVVDNNVPTNEDGEHEHEQTDSSNTTDNEQQDPTNQGDDEPLNMKVWEETKYVHTAEDDEFDDLDAVAYARAIAKRLGILNVKLSATALAAGGVDGTDDVQHSLELIAKMKEKSGDDDDGDAAADDDVDENNNNNNNDDDDDDDDGEDGGDDDEGEGEGDGEDEDGDDNDNDDAAAAAATATTSSGNTTMKSSTSSSASASAKDPVAPATIVNAAVFKADDLAALPEDFSDEE